MRKGTQKIKKTRWIGGKQLALAIAVMLPIMAQAIPLSVLHAQETNRENIEAAIRTVDKDCAECREQIVAALHHYIAGMQANIDFCTRLTSPGYEQVIAEAINEYRANRQWAYETLKKITERPLKRSEFLSPIA